MPPREHVPVANYTSLRIGGLARWFVTVASTEEVRSALDFAQSRSIRWAVFGSGQSTLVADDGFDGLVIQCLGTARQHLHAGSLVFAGDTLGQRGSVAVQAMHGQISTSAIAEYHWMNVQGSIQIVPSEQWAVGAYQQAPGILLGIVPTQDIVVSPAGERPPLPSAQVFLPQDGKAASAMSDVGCAGKTLGKVQLWEQDPTWLMAKPGATADEVVQLMSLVKQQVRDTLQIQLRDALSYLGM